MLDEANRITYAEQERASQHRMEYTTWRTLHSGQAIELVCLTCGRENCSQCVNCRQFTCHQRCNCGICEYHGGDVMESICRSCDRCMDCCECLHCVNCGVTHSLCDTCQRCQGDGCFGCDCRWCNNCESYMRRNTACRRCGYCSNCCEGDCGRIHSYSYDPDYVTFISDDDVVTTETFQAPDGKPYLGLEIETEAVHCSAVSIAKIWEGSGLGYGKSDGSLNDGVECVTHPITYRAMLDLDLEGTLKAMYKQGARAWDTGTCGLHVHVSRKAFKNKAHMWRFCLAIQENSTDLVKLSGRNSEEWASWQMSKQPVKQRNYYGDMTEYWPRPAAPTKVIAGKANAQDRPRYCAVNLLNDETIELRFWRGSVRPATVLGVAAVVDALIQWTAKLTLRDVSRGVQFTRFIGWCQDNLDETQWQHILGLLKARGMIANYPQLDREETDTQCA